MATMTLFIPARPIFNKVIFDYRLPLKIEAICADR
jgi:hypothetical protein